MEFLSAKWLWLYAGAGLAFAELFVPGFVVFFFGMAACTVGALLFVLPAAFQPALAGQLALFSLFSVVYLVTLRRYAKDAFLGEFGAGGRNDKRGAAGAVDAFAGRTATVVEAIAAGGEGRVELGDARWTAVAAEAGGAFAVGARVRVVGHENLTLSVVAA